MRSLNNIKGQPACKMYNPARSWFGCCNPRVTTWSWSHKTLRKGFFFSVRDFNKITTFYLDFKIQVKSQPNLEVRWWKGFTVFQLWIPASILRTLLMCLITYLGEDTGERGYWKLCHQSILIYLVNSFVCYWNRYCFVHFAVWDTWVLCTRVSSGESVVKLFSWYLRRTQKCVSVVKLFGFTTNLCTRPVMMCAPRWPCHVREGQFLLRAQQNEWNKHVKETRVCGRAFWNTVVRRHGSSSESRTRYVVLHYDPCVTPSVCLCVSL